VDLDLRKLRYYVAVAEELHLTTLTPGTPASTENIAWHVPGQNAIAGNYHRIPTIATCGCPCRRSPSTTPATQIRRRPILGGLTNDHEIAV
jgi:hypothetical protein